MADKFRSKSQYEAIQRWARIRLTRLGILGAVGDGLFYLTTGSEFTIWAFKTSTDLLEKYYPAVSTTLGMNESAPLINGTMNHAFTTASAATFTPHGANLFHTVMSSIPVDAATHLLVHAARALLPIPMF